ncbi:MAG: hypothetical protein ACPIOQ_62655 [Promethearchaeia archaeon]
MHAATGVQGVAKPKARTRTGLSTSSVLHGQWGSGEPAGVDALRSAPTQHPASPESAVAS